MGSLSSLYGREIAQGITGSARALGMDPLDLATIISYETAGTFNPRAKGPVTQWGQHEGFIQFGKPQARQYGVDWANPVNSQLGPDGAVVKYFQGNGYKPGMGLLDAYSIVNAGAPGRYNASDANNGGAPGTVRDKVTNQMAGHRANAEKMLAGLLGGGPQALPEQRPGATPGLADALAATAPQMQKRLGAEQNTEAQRKALADLIRF